MALTDSSLVLDLSNLFSLARLNLTAAILFQSLPRSIADDIPFIIYKIDNLTTFAFNASNDRTLENSVTPK